MGFDGRRILITGAGGFIGSALLKRLYDLSPVAIYHHAKPSLEYHSWKQVDLSDVDAVRKLVQEVRPEIVYHLAALTSPQRNEQEPELARKMNFNITENIINTLPQETHMVFISTDKVFDGSDPNPDEQAMTSPQWLYARLKVECENLLRHVPRHHILRLGIVHAMGEEWACTVGSGTASFIDRGIAEMKLGKTVSVFNNVNRCYVRLSRLIDLFSIILNDKNYCLYHVGSPMMTYYDRMKQLGQELGLDWQNLLVPSEGKTVPMSQNMNTAKLRATFKVIFD